MIYKTLNALGIDIPSGKINFDVICPNCGKKKLNINLAKGVFRCPRCNTGGGPVALYGLVKHGIDPSNLKGDKATVRKLIKEIDSDSDESSYKTAPHPVIERVDVEPQKIEERDKCYNLFLSHLSLSETHHKNLLDRGLTEKVIQENDYKSFPASNFQKITNLLIKEGASLLGTPGFYEDNGAWKIQRNNSAFFVPVRNIQGQIQGMQLRFDDPWEGQKYRWFSSANKKNGCGAKTWPHFSGFPENTVFLTEGPLKADIISHYLDVPVIGIPGVNALQNLIPMLEELKKYGTNCICTAFDMDYLTNEHVQKAYLNLCKLIAEHGFKLRKYAWDSNYKGLDDYLLARYFKERGVKK